MKIALQLYTIRDSYTTKEEFFWALQKVKEMGYDGVEFAGYANVPAKELREYLEQIQLRPLSCHHGLEELEHNKKEILAYIHELGCNYLVCSYATTSTLEEVGHVQQVMVETKELAKTYGIETAYHNHWHEFLPFSDGSIPIELIKKTTKLEVDTYWLYSAMEQPIQYLKENSKNVVLLHLKDGDDEKHPCALGEGVCRVGDFAQFAKDNSFQWVIVENDNPIPDGLSDAKRSIEYLLKIVKI